MKRLFFCLLLLGTSVRSAAASLLPAFAQEDGGVSIINHANDIKTPAPVPDSSQDIEPATDLELLEAIRAVIYTAEGIDVLTQSMLDRPSLDGQPKSLEDLIDEWLIYRDGASKANISEATIDAGIAQFKKQNNLTDAQLNEFFERNGYTLAEGRQEFKRLQMVGQMIEHNVGGKMRIIPEAEIKRYYDEHPISQEASYILERAQVSESMLRNATTMRTKAEWTQLPEVKESELASHLHFIINLKVEQMSKPRKLDNGEYEIFRLKAKTERHAVPLEERRREIIGILRKPRYEQALAEYKKRLRDGAHIVYFGDEIDKELVGLVE